MASAEYCPIQAGAAILIELNTANHFPTYPIQKSVIMKNNLWIAIAAIFTLHLNAQTPTENSASAQSAAVPTTTATTSAADKKEPEPDLSKLTDGQRKQLVFETIQSGDTNRIKPLLKTLVYYRHNDAGETALTQAIENNDAAMVRVLVRDAVINLKNQNGETPLILALKKGNPEIITLVSRRAKAGLKNDAGESPLLLALERGDDLLLLQRLLAKGADASIPALGVSPIYRATELNNVQAVALLLRYGANPSLPNETGETPLVHAVSKGYDVIAGILLHKSKQAQQDANWANQLGEPLLILAAKGGRTQIAKILLDYGADPMQMDHLENTALHIAAEKGYADLVKIMLEKGAPADQPNIMGTTPIMAAARNNNAEIAKILADHGANPDRRNYEGIAANDYGSFQMKQLMEQQYDDLLKNQPQEMDNEQK